MCFSLLTVILLVVGRCGVADAAAPGCQTFSSYYFGCSKQPERISGRQEK